MVELHTGICVLFKGSQSKGYSVRESDRNDTAFSVSSKLLGHAAKQCVNLITSS